MKFGEMYILLIRCFLLQITIILVDSSEVVSEENYDLAKDRSKETVDFDSYRSNRRVQDDINDEEWHVAHLKDVNTGFSEGSCKSETFEERATKYRRKLREDGARVRFVVAESIPVGDEDLKDVKNPCLTDNGTRVDGDKVFNKLNTKINNSKKSDEKASNLNGSLDNVTINPNTATTVNAKAALTISDSLEYAKTDKSRRGGEYQFSSVEYYEDTLDFDKSKCPDEVEVIVLEIDQLRSYDIECERIIEWRSLE